MFSVCRRKKTYDDALRPDLRTRHDACDVSDAHPFRKTRRNWRKKRNQAKPTDVTVLYVGDFQVRVRFSGQKGYSVQVDVIIRGFQVVPPC